MPERSNISISQVLDELPHILWLAHHDGSIYYVNHFFLNYFQLRMDQVQNWGWLSRIPEDQRNSLKLDLRNYFEKGLRFEIQTQLIRGSDGARRLHVVKGVPQKNVNTQTMNWVITCTDIEDAAKFQNLKSEEALKESRHELQEFITLSPIPMCIFHGPNHVYAMTNPAHDRLLGKPVLGKTIREAHTEREAGDAPAMLDRVYQTKQPVFRKEIPYTILGDDGVRRSFWIHEWFYPFLNQKGEILGILGVAQDVTEQVSARKEAERANLSKTAFLANISHEIRTPMSAVLGFTEILKDSDLTESERHDVVGRIENSGRTLLRLIDDVLDISKVEAGKFYIHKAKFSPHEILSEVIALLKPQAAQKGLSLNSELSLSVPRIAVSDSARIKQILTNLIGNAIKFTHRGEVRVKLGAEKDEESGKEFLIFEVIDTGIGIAESDREKLFQPFAQADASITRRFGGTGLGLALSKHLAHFLGGDLRIEHSEPGQGSHFIVKIDAGPSSKLNHEESTMHPQAKIDPAKPTEKTSLNAARILVVDDVLDNQMLMRRYLENAGARVEVANDGEEAVSKALSHHYDVVLMDIQMPRLDGIQATRLLRAKEYERPILALTAHAMREEVARSLEAGCDEHLTKPISKQGLVEAVQKYITVERRV